jgi:hypothetical protein
MKHFSSALLFASSALFAACPLPESGDPVCGDTIIEYGNTADGDGCDASCQDEKRGASSLYQRGQQARGVSRLETPAKRAPLSLVAFR